MGLVALSWDSPVASHVPSSVVPLVSPTLLFLLRLFAQPTMGECVFGTRHLTARLKGRPTWSVSRQTFTATRFAPVFLRLDSQMQVVFLKLKLPSEP